MPEGVRQPQKPNSSTMPATDRPTYNLFVIVSSFALILMHQIPFATLLILAVLAIATSSRLKDIGYPPAYGFLALAPVANVLLVLAALSFPRHNGRSIRLDKAGWVLLCAWLLAPVIVVVILGTFGSSSRPY